MGGEDEVEALGAVLVPRGGERDLRRLAVERRTEEALRAREDLLAHLASALGVDARQTAVAVGRHEIGFAIDIAIVIWAQNYEYCMLGCGGGY